MSRREKTPKALNLLNLKAGSRNPLALEAIGPDLESESSLLDAAEGAVEEAEKRRRLEGFFRALGLEKGLLIRV